MAIATGQFTITDYNDAPILTSWISANNSKTQGYTPDNDTYIPDYSKTPMTLTASLFITGTSINILETPEGIVSNMEWYKLVNGVEQVIPGSQGSHTYIVNTNLTSENSRTYTFKCNYTQDTSGLEVPVRATIELNKVINGSGVADAIVIAPRGNVFKNDVVNELPAECQLWVGSKLEDKVTASSFKWWKMDGAGVGGSHGVGEGWALLTHGVNGYTIDFSNSTSIINIPKSDVFSNAVYMCTVEDPSTRKIFKETINFLDTTDPIYMEIFSPGGNIFKNGEGSTILTAKVYQNGVEIDNQGNKYTYTWYQYDKDGNSVDRQMRILSTKASIATGKQLPVTHEDVTVKATFLCELS